MTQSITLEINFLDTELTVTGDYTPAVAGKLSGPWEDSYPGEPSDFEVTEILVGGISIYELAQCCAIAQNTQPISHRDFLLELAEACCQALDNQEQDFDEPDGDLDDADY